MLSRRSTLIALGALPLSGQVYSGPARPAIEFTTDEQYDVGQVAAYRGVHQDVYDHIEAHRTEHLEQLRRWIGQRSISAQNDGVAEMAAMLRDDLRSIGFGEAAIVPTSGHPGVWGYFDAGAARTVLVYMMYDVQPVEPADWQVPPFEAALVDDHPLGRVLMARGATNQKGPQRAFLNAVASIIRTRGRLPVNLMILAEGEEELGSVHFPELIARFQDRLSTASGVLFPMNTQEVSGAVSVELGVKGVLYFELEARGNAERGPQRAEIHSSLKAIVDAPAWRLTQALALLTSRDGNTITVPGYYDSIRPPTLEEQRLANAMLPAWTSQQADLREALGVARWVDGMNGRAILGQYLFGTTLNIAGLSSGYGGPGPKTILPHRAIAKLDSRLVPNQTPEEARRLIRRHLDQNGFEDIEMRTLSAFPPASSSVEDPFVQRAIGAYRKYDLPISLVPRQPGSAPYYVFTETLGLPIVAVGLGYGTAYHAPNEYLVVEPRRGSAIAGLAEQERFYVDLLYALAA